MPLNRLAIWIANGALALVCCWLAAGIASDVAGAWLAPTPEEVAEQAVVPQAVARTWASRKAILDRNLFKAALGNGEAEQVDEDLAATKLPLKLLGTAASGSDARRSWAAVEDMEKRQHMVVRVGDRLQGKAEVTRIERRRLVLRNGGRLEELALGDEMGPGGAVASTNARGRRYSPRATPAAANAPPGGNDPEERVQRLAEDRFGLAREDVQSVANNPAALFSQARILPKYEDGKMKGVQLNAIQAGSVFEQIGIRNGDTITEFNGIHITSQQDSAAVLRQLTESTEFNVTVTGADGQERRLTYELR
jgi:general secretion pathway protein C